ncbi:MAG TPA: polysaccharide lyase family 8 super-sandwich domain-containing protein [Pseudomonadales bacterium]|nr:polysaccharide lyase family 8 super-sandwich domain-containing protein [Pseudomonadales bacterium]
MFLSLPVLDLQADQFDTLRIYWQNYLLNNAGSPSSVTANANNLWSSMDTSSSRSDVWSYLPLGSSSANLTTTYQQLEQMALAYAMPGSSLHGNASLAQAINGGLDYISTNFYTPTTSEYGNWYDWEIGSPQALNNAAALMYATLTTSELTNYINSENHYAPGSTAATYGWMTGANTSDKVLVGAICGILSKNAGQLTSAQTNLSPVFLYVTSSDGFYTDGSFVFHSNIAYNGHYGLVLLGDIPKIVLLLQGSTWQITDPNLTNVYNWVSKSFEPFVYNGAMMDMVRGRVASWSYETESDDGSGTFSAASQIAQFAPAPVAQALTAWVNSPSIPSGQFHFADNDRVVAIRNGFAFGLSMSSSRIANYESINGGNLHGWFTGSGMTYLYISNNVETQYSGDFWPTVDPYHLPGTTAETATLANSANEAKTTGQPWAGGAQVKNTYGVAGMSLHGLSTTLFAKKSWFMFDDEIACLGAGITSGDSSEVDTTVENRRLGNPITSSFAINGTNITPTVGWSSTLPSNRPSWCALGGTGGYYFPVGNTNLQVTFTANTGSWSQINSGDSSTSYTDDYFKIWLNHGVQPTNATYSYVILPNMNATSVRNYMLAPDIAIITNTPFIQAVKKSSLGIVAANFWTNNGSADLVSVNGQASVITTESSNGILVGISDPTQTNTSSLTVTLNRGAIGYTSADAGITVLQLSPKIVFSVNVNGAQGKAFQASFAYTNSLWPILSNVSPVGGNLFESTNTFAFNVASGYGIPSSNVIVTVNGIAATNLVLSGSNYNWNVSYPHLLPNTVYTVAVSVTDTNGNIATTTKSFDTFDPANYTWEAEDFDYNGGRFIDNPQTNAYAGLSALVNADTHQVNFGGKDLYRPNGMDTEINGDTLRPQYNGTGYSDYSVGYFSPGSWLNYTRHYPVGTYNIYARLAAGGGATACTLSRVTNGWGTTAQTTNFLGTFSVPNTAWESYNYIPLVDNLGNMVSVSFNGSTNTLQLGRPASATSDCNANFLMLVPVFALNFSIINTNLVISFPTQSGFQYQVQFKNDLTAPEWMPLGDSLAGNSLTESVTNPVSAQACFYRVQIH